MKKKALIIGSGPIIIGQACEFDYSGTQACKALRNLGYEIVLVNSNPATIMTDPEMADATYIEPMNVSRLEQIIEKYKPQQMAIEELFWNTNQKTGIRVAEARGVILLAAYKCGVDVYEYTPLEVKGFILVAEMSQYDEHCYSLRKHGSPCRSCNAHVKHEDEQRIKQGVEQDCEYGQRHGLLGESG